MTMNVLPGALGGVVRACGGAFSPAVALEEIVLMLAFLSPPVRVPPLPECAINRELARKFIQELDCELSLYGMTIQDDRASVIGGGMRAIYLLRLREDAVARRVIWDHLFVASSDVSRERRWEYLDILRAIMGDEAFYAEEWPCPIP